MAKITLQGNPINTIGDLPKVGSKAPDFKLVGKDVRDLTLADFKGKKKILDIVVQLDTSICAISARKFSDYAATHPDTAVLVISADLPATQARVCGADAPNVTTLSMMRDKNFAKDYGILITDGPIAGLTARSVVVLDKDDKVLYTQLVPEIAQEPDYDKALAALK
jgi:thiol peroxidase